MQGWARTPFAQIAKHKPLLCGGVTFRVRLYAMLVVFMLNFTKKIVPWTCGKILFVQEIGKKKELQIPQKLEDD